MSVMGGICRSSEGALHFVPQSVCEQEKQRAAHTGRFRGLYDVICRLAQSRREPDL